MQTYEIKEDHGLNAGSWTTVKAQNIDSLRKALIKKWNLYDAGDTKITVHASAKGQFGQPMIGKYIGTLVVDNEWGNLLVCAWTSAKDPSKYHVYPYDVDPKTGKIKPRNR